MLSLAMKAVGTFSFGSSQRAQETSCGRELILVQVNSLLWKMACQRRVPERDPESGPGLAELLEQSTALRNRARLQQRLTQWPSKECMGAASYKALALNATAMETIASWWTKMSGDPQAIPIDLLRSEAGESTCANCWQEEVPSQPAANLHFQGFYSIKSLFQGDSLAGLDGLGWRPVRHLLGQLGVKTPPVTRHSALVVGLEEAKGALSQISFCLLMLKFLPPKNELAFSTGFPHSRSQDRALDGLWDIFDESWGIREPINGDEYEVDDGGPNLADLAIEDGQADGPGAGSEQKGPAPSPATSDAEPEAPAIDQAAPAKGEESKVMASGSVGQNELRIANVVGRMESIRPVWIFSAGAWGELSFLWQNR